MNRHTLRILGLSLVLLVALTGAWLLTTSVSHPPRIHAQGEITTHQLDGQSYLMYVPTSAREGKPITALIAIGGMGYNPESYAAAFAPVAEQNGWLLIVPRFNYGDWRQVDAVKHDDKAQLPWLKSLIDALPSKTSLQVRGQVLMYGFSRGAQAVHRFALMYHDQVLAVAAMSAGTYTLPVDCPAPLERHTNLDYPVGVKDLASYCGEPLDPEGVKSVAFWVGVGEQDNQAGDVPRSWDRYIGTTRVDRAKHFVESLKMLGARVEFDIVSNLGHNESVESRGAAMSFLKTVDDERAAAEDAAEAGLATAGQ